jgi:hypothetical protein
MEFIWKYIKSAARSIWKYTKLVAKIIGQWMLQYPLAAAAAVFLIILALFAALSGNQLQMGGLIGKLFGKKKQPNTREIVPEDRVNEDGKPITPGESDDKGFVQAPTNLEVVEPTIFSDPDTIIVKHPEKGKIKIDLPKGVKNKDVKEVVLIKPDIVEIKNNDKGVDTKKILEFLK